MKRHNSVITQTSGWQMQRVRLWVCYDSAQGINIQDNSHCEISSVCYIKYRNMIIEEWFIKLVTAVLLSNDIRNRLYKYFDARMELTVSFKKKPILITSA